jgi:PEGA domain/PDZ domain
MRRIFALLLCLAIPLALLARDNGYEVTYDGGSLADTKSGTDVKLHIERNQIRFVKGKKELIVIPASSVTEVSYGQDVHRRVGTAVAVAVFSLGIGALVALSKSKKHYVGLIWADSDKKGGLVIQCDKNEYRGILAALEGITGKKAVDSDTFPVKSATATAAEQDKPTVSAQPVAAAAFAAVLTVSATLEISSTPPDADIELDGSFAGNTPSSVGVEAGEHIIKITKNGFNPWVRKIKSSTGTARVSANLDPIRVATSAAPALSAVIQQQDGAVPSAALASNEPSPSSTVSSPNPEIDAPVSEVDEVNSTTPAAKNTVMETFLGVSSDEKKGERRDGVRIDGITLGGPADNAGLKLGDYILSIDNHYLFTIEELESETRSHKLGARVAVRYRRYSTIDEASVTIGGDTSTR